MAYGIYRRRPPNKAHRVSHYGLVYQIGTPNSDVAAASWTTAPLYQKIDEANPGDDSDFITSETLVVSGDTSIAKIGISSLNDPISGNSHILRFRAQDTLTLGTAATLTVELREGSTLRASITVDLTTSFQAFQYVLTQAEANAITDYTVLQVWLKGTFAVGNLGGVQVSYLEFDVPYKPPTFYTVNINDSVSTTDAIAKNFGKTNADTSTTTDATARNVGKTNSDTVTDTDAVAKQVGKTNADTVTDSDAIAKQVGKNISDTVVDTDATARSVGKTNTDTVTTTHAVAKDVGKAIADTVTTTHAFSKAVGKNINDAVATIDALARAIGKTISEIIVTTDVAAKTFGKFLADAVTVSDQISDQLFQVEIISVIINSAKASGVINQSPNNIVINESDNSVIIDDRVTDSD